MPPQSEDYEHSMTNHLGFTPGKMTQNCKMNRTLHEHFAQSCHGREMLDALVDAGSSMSFAKLQSRSTSLAKLLTEATRGSQPSNAPIAVCIDGFSRCRLALRPVRKIMSPQK